MRVLGCLRGRALLPANVHNECSRTSEAPSPYGLYWGKAACGALNIYYGHGPPAWSVLQPKTPPLAIWAYPWQVCSDVMWNRLQLAGKKKKKRTCGPETSGYWKLETANPGSVSIIFSLYVSVCLIHSEDEAAVCSSVSLVWAIFTAHSEGEKWRQGHLLL